MKKSENKRAQITYSVNIKDVPKELDNMMTRVASTLPDPSKARKIGSKLADPSVSFVSKEQELEEFLQQVENAFYAIEDCLSILRGLEQAKAAELITSQSTDEI